MRCMALSQAAQMRGVQSVFLLPAEGFKLAQCLRAARPDWTAALSNASVGSAETVAALKAVCAESRPRVVIIDGPSFAGEILEAVVAADVPIVLLDDGNPPSLTKVSVVVNPAGAALTAMYRECYPQANLCVGRHYRLLRREFTDAPLKPMAAREGIVINFGGSDPLDMTLPLLGALAQLRFDAPVCVVTGAGYRCGRWQGEKASQALQARTETYDLNLNFVHNSSEMASIWSSAKLAVSAAGGSLFELVACGTPSLLVVVGENQQQAASDAGEEGWCEVYHAWRDDAGNTGLDTIDGAGFGAGTKTRTKTRTKTSITTGITTKIAERIYYLYQKPKVLTQMMQCAQQHAIKDGAERVLAQIMRVY